MSAALALGSPESGTQCNRAGAALARRPQAFEAPAPVTPVRVPPLPLPRRATPRWLCVQCGRAADDPQDLCEPVPVS